jgi:hypothetical protein
VDNTLFICSTTTPTVSLLTLTTISNLGACPTC